MSKEKKKEKVILRRKPQGYNISIVISTGRNKGKRKRLEAIDPLSEEKNPLVHFRTKSQARAMIATLTPNTRQVYRPRVVRAKK